MDKFLHKNWMVKALQTSSWVLHLVSLLTCSSPIFTASAQGILTYVPMEDAIKALQWIMQIWFQMQNHHLIFRPVPSCFCWDLGAVPWNLPTNSTNVWIWSNGRLAERLISSRFLFSRLWATRHRALSALMLAKPSFALRKEGQFRLVDGRFESAPETIYANRIHLLSKNMGEDYLQHVVLLCWRKSLVEKLFLFFEVTRDC